MCASAVTLAVNGIVGHPLPLLFVFPSSASGHFVFAISTAVSVFTSYATPVADGILEPVRAHNDSYNVNMKLQKPHMASGRGVRSRRMSMLPVFRFHNRRSGTNCGDPSARADNGAQPAPLVSVVIPTHNRPEQLRDALASALQQTHVQLEVIVVDDASTADIQSVVESFADARVRYVGHDTKRGGSAARNTGIEHAKGEFIAFLDDDDRWKPNKVAQQLQQIQGFDAVICGYHLKAGEREIPGTKGDGTMFPVDRRLLRRGQVGWGASSFFGRAERVKEIGFDEALPAGQDWDLLIRFAERYKVQYVDEPLVAIGVGAHGRISTRKANERLVDIENRMTVLRKHKEFLGRFWYRYHEARMLLFGIRQRPDRWKFAAYAVRRCGIVPIMAGRVWQFYTALFGYRY